MSKTFARLPTITRVIFLVLLALVTISEPILVLIFFIPIIGWLIWRDQDKIAELERRLAALEPSTPKPKPEGS